MSEFSEIADQQNEDESDKAAGFRKGLSMPALFTGFFLSGFAALVYEIAWQRILVRITGATLPATTIILGIFLAGLMAGGLLAGFALKNSSPRRSRNLLIVAELLVAALAMASTVLTCSRFLEYITGGLPIWLSSALLLLPPMILMGATLPLISGVLVSGSRLTWIYAGNTAGAFTGALMAGFVMLPYLGLSRTILLTGTLNIVAACLFQYACKDNEDEAETSRESTGFLASLKTLGAPLAIAAFSSGLIFFFMEVIWTRFLVNILGSSTYAFTGVTAICILALAAGTVAAQTLFRRAGLFANLGLSSILLASSLYAMSCAPGIYLSLPAETFLQRLLANLVATSLVVLAPAIALGSIFPFCLREGTDETGSARGSTAALLFLNLSGCLAGVLLARAIFEVSARGFIVSATETGTMIMAALPVLVGLFLFGRRRLSLMLVLITGIILFTRPPLDLKMQGAGLASIDRSENAGLPTEQILKALSGENSEIVFYREGPASTISIKRAKSANLTLLIRNGKVEAQIPTDMRRPAPGSDLATHTLLGFLPYLYTKTQGSNALLIGYGSGTTCNTMSRLPGLASLTAVDIDPGVFETDSFFHSADSSSNSHGVKPKKVVADARRHLLSSKKKYEIIVSQPSEPWVAGAGDLFSKEYFELLQSRLADQGVVCQWLQLYGLDRESLTVLLATFHSAFPGACIYRPVNAGEIILVAVKGIEKGNIINMPSRELGAELYRIGLLDTDDFLSSRVVLAGELGSLARNSTMLNTDNNLYCEYALGSREHASLEIATLDSLPIEKLDRSPGRGSLALAQAWRLRQEGKWQSDIALCEAMPGMKPQARKEPSKYLPLAARRCLSIVEDLDGPAGDGIIYGARAAQIIAPATGPLEALSIRRAQLLQAAPEPASTGARLTLAAFYLNEGMTDRAKATLASLPEDIETASAIEDGYLEFFSGNRARARSRFEHLSSIPEQAENPRVLTGLALSTPDSKERIAILRKSLRINPNQLTAFYMLGQSLYQQGAIEESLSAMKEAGRLDNNNPWPYLFTACALAEQGKTDLARANMALLRQKLPGERGRELFDALQRSLEGKDASGDREKLIDFLACLLPLQGHNLLNR
ncbi:MAG: hypothetical protein AB7W16_02315 [Candidatus Obscuribacterales bacterium]